MFRVKISEDSLKGFIGRKKKRFLKNIDEQLGPIRREVTAELQSQQRRFSRSSKWLPLSSEYRAQKRYQYLHRGATGVRYVTTLKRTGRMMEGYSNGIRVIPSRFTVMVPYPTKYARVQQLGSGATNAGHGNIPPRPFDIVRLKDIAVKAFTEGVKKSVNG